MRSDRWARGGGGGVGKVVVLMVEHCGSFSFVLAVANRWDRREVMHVGE
jgi:hypothetical protein